MFYLPRIESKQNFFLTLSIFPAVMDQSDEVAAIPAGPPQEQKGSVPARRRRRGRPRILRLRISSLCSLTQTDLDIPACFSGIDVIFIDEVSMCNHRVLVILDRKLRRLMSNDESFGGKCVILCGDFHQCNAAKTKQLTTQQF